MTEQPVERTEYVKMNDTGPLYRRCDSVFSGNSGKSVQQCVRIRTHTGSHCGANGVQWKE